MRVLLLVATVAGVVAASCAHGREPAAPAMPVLPPPPMDAIVQTSAPTGVVSPLDTILLGDWRPEGNKARDKYRHPRETLAFFGVNGQQNLIEIWPGGGWYAQVLAPLLRDGGSYIAVIPDPAKGGGAEGKARTARGNQKLRDQFAARPDVFGKAKLLEVDSAAPVLGPPGSTDVVLTFRNVHNWVMAGQQQQMFKAFYTVLKPGGTLGVVDHRARPEQPAAEMKTSGYLPEAYVIALATAAGFRLVDKSEINANPRDSKDYADGVWTLPPTLARGDQEREKYLAIGESDRMTLRFVKPSK